MPVVRLRNAWFDATVLPQTGGGLATFDWAANASCVVLGSGPRAVEKHIDQAEAASVGSLPECAHTEQDETGSDDPGHSRTHDRVQSSADASGPIRAAPILADHDHGDHISSAGQNGSEAGYPPGSVLARHYPLR